MLIYKNRAAQSDEWLWVCDLLHHHAVSRSSPEARRGARAELLRRGAWLPLGGGPLSAGGAVPPGPVGPAAPGPPEDAPGQGARRPGPRAAPGGGGGARPAQSRVEPARLRLHVPARVPPQERPRAPGLPGWLGDRTEVWCATAVVVS